jgi:hypothetical protein
MFNNMWFRTNSGVAPQKNLFLASPGKIGDGRSPICELRLVIGDW